ncbi:hypothetical protein RJ641_009042 [Dillenia turbinata]|uniref:Uncharacterized protein n=1 Tax=Dillenia turbinata TaxID=194707 RepID=A0AAN8V712_9MAGN
MATAAFKSTTKRTPMGGKSSSSTEDSASSSKTHRRARSLSRFSRPLTGSSVDFEETPGRRGKFVNTVRGSGFPEISLDDLAIEFFPTKDSTETESERERVSRRRSEISPSMAESARQAAVRRGRSVSRRGSCNEEKKSGASNGSSSRRRSVSVVRHQICDSEGEADLTQNSSHFPNSKMISCANNDMLKLQKPTLSGPQRLQRSLSQKDLSKLHDGYSSHSSSLTDDEARDGRSVKNGIEKTIRAVYSRKKMEHPNDDGSDGCLYEVMRKELRNAVEEIKMELEQTMVKTKASTGDCLEVDDSNVLEAVSTIRRNYATKLEESAKRKQDLLAEIMLEEQRGKELSKIVRDLIPDSKKTAPIEKPSQSRKRSNDRSKMSKCLTEEAEKYIEEFLSNVEDTDISSLDGERSEASSTFWSAMKSRDPVMQCREIEALQSPVLSNSTPVEMDGVVLPWLQWETNESPNLHKKWTAKSSPLDSVQELSNTHDQSNCSISSHGSWSPGVVDGPAKRGGSIEKLLVSGIYKNLSFSNEPRKPQFDLDRYLELQRQDDIPFERFKEQERIHSGGLLLCCRPLF